MGQLLALALLVELSTGCRTTGGDSTPSAMKGEGFATTLELAKTEEQALYLMMLQVELNTGVKVAKDRLHSVAGLASCSKANALETCEVRVRLGERDLSATQPLDRDLAEKLWAFARQVRPELADESLVFADLICDYIGKESPPYTIEDVDCRATFPRTVNEAVFADTPAEELSDLLRGDSSFGDGLLTLNGTIACQAVENSPRRLCVVRAIQQGVLSEKVREVSDKNSGNVASRLFQTLQDLVKLESKPVTTKPREVVGSLTCVVDSSRYAAEERRLHKCRAAL